MIDKPLEERFPALRRLQILRGRRTIPYVPQSHATDCGAACLTMVLHYHGNDVSYETVRDRMGSTRDGVDARMILDGARSFQLRGRGVRLELSDLEYVDPGTILHWNFNHFVVYESHDRKGIRIVDPGVGRRLLQLDEFSRSFTGVALALEPGVGFERTRTRGSHVWAAVRRVMRESGLMTRVILMTALLQVLGLALPVVTGLLVDRIIPRGDVELLLVVGLGVAGVTVFSLVGSLVRSFMLLQMRTQLEARMSLDLLEHMLSLPLSFLQLRPTGDLITRMGSNSNIRETLTSGVISGALDGLAAVGYLLVLTVINWSMGLLAALLGLARVLVFLLTRGRVLDLATRGLAAQSDSNSYQVQMFEGVETLKSSGAEHRALEHWSGHLVNVLNVSVATGRLNAFTEAAIGGLTLLSPLMLIGYGAWLVLTGQITLGAMLALNALAVGFLAPISSLTRTALQIQGLRSHVNRVEDIFQASPEQGPDASRSKCELEGGFKLEEVSFRYSEGAPLAVERVGLEIAPGERIAIVGRSGCGKSTLLKLVLGLYAPTSGRVLLDGKDLAELDLQSVRQQVGLVQQTPYLFGTSIRSNIAVRQPQAPLEAVMEAARIACIHDEIAAMPLGYETPLLAGGGAISGGQRQRIAIARAVLGRPRLLMLDEATNQLDAITEKRVLEELSRLRITQVFVAHRLSAVKDSDRIFVMERGRMVEEGRHRDLMEVGGSYAELIRGQSGPISTGR